MANPFNHRVALPVEDRAPIHHDVPVDDRNPIHREVSPTPIDPNDVIDTDATAIHRRFAAWDGKLDPSLVLNAPIIKTVCTTKTRQTLQSLPNPDFYTILLASGLSVEKLHQVLSAHLAKSPVFVVEEKSEELYNLINKFANESNYGVRYEAPCSPARGDALEFMEFLKKTESKAEVEKMREAVKRDVERRKKQVEQCKQIANVVNNLVGRAMDELETAKKYEEGNLEVCEKMLEKLGGPVAK